MSGSANSSAAPQLRSTRAGSRAVAVALLALLAPALLGLGILSVLAGATLDVASPASSPGGEDGPSALALKAIPPRFLRLYQAAAARYGLDWAVLAGIGKVECDHGLDPAPSCWQQGAVNSAGAGGPMQFLASTWSRYGVDAEGSGPPDRWNAADAIYAAANYLRASGAPSDYEAALLAYNDAHWYVAEVLRWASRYRGSESQQAGAADAGANEGADIQLAERTRTPVLFIAGERARLDPEDGHVALIPTGVPATVQALLVAGNELEDLPYGPAGHPDPLGATQEDCSSSVNYVLYRAGIRPLAEIVARNPLAQGYVDWGEPGPGRWVTIYATDAPSPHVFIVIAGLRLDTVGGAADVGPNSAEQGPRWRLLDHLPDWAEWSVRHPPGL